MPRAKPTKKRKFYGNKYTRPLKETAKPCASEEKLQYTKKRSVVAELDGYRLIDVRNLVNFVSAFPCPNCGGHGYTVTEDIAGLRSFLSFECMNHDCGHTYKLNSQPDGESVNSRFEMAMFSIGRNRQQAVRLLGEMNMPPPVSCTMWNKTKDKIHEATRSVAGESMRRAAQELRDGTGCTNVTVSCDGSWQRRGFQSKNGVATVLSVNPRGPAKVVDVHVSSNYCNTCKTQASKLSEAEFNAWYENHKGRCQKNHDGSAGAMEPDGMPIIFRCSEEKHGLVYTGYLGDGDSKSYHTVASADPPIYPENDISKLECCGHVQKRMGKRLIDTVSEMKGKQFKEGTAKFKGIGGAGRLTQRAIKSIQGHYGGAIRDHPGDTVAMKRAIWAIWRHRAKDHSYCGISCPAVGPEKDLERANKSALPKHVMKAIKPVFEKLSSDDLLEKCAHGGTQNANESLHNMIWARCPKTVFVGRTRLEIAVCDAVLVYNEGERGRLGVFELLRLKCGHNMIEMIQAIDRKRITSAIGQSTKSAKQLRKTKGLSKAPVKDSTYQAGAF